MKRSENYIINVLAVGFFTLVLLSVLLFWGRKLIQGWTFEERIVGKDGTSIIVKPSGLLPQLDTDPNVVKQSFVSAATGDGVVYHSLGIFTDLIEGMFDTTHRFTHNGMRGKLRYFRVDNMKNAEGTYFDKDIKKFIYIMIKLCI